MERGYRCLRLLMTLDVIKLCDVTQGLRQSLVFCTSHTNRQ